MLRQAILGFVPLNLQDFVLKIIAEVFTKSAAVVPISGLFALWSSGKGMQSLIAGLNVIYHVKETRNWLTNRLYSMLYMFLFVLAIIISLLLLVMGNRIHAALVIHAPLLGRMLGRLLSAKDLSGICCVVSGISRFVQISSKQKGITEKVRYRGHLLSQLHGHCFHISFHCILHSFRISAICMAVCLH